MIFIHFIFVKIKFQNYSIKLNNNEEENNEIFIHEINYLRLPQEKKNQIIYSLNSAL